ncbi:MAG: DUF393 domain-containing protein, partial [Pseudomonadota bacterium]
HGKDTGPAQAQPAAHSGSTGVGRKRLRLCPPRYCNRQGETHDAPLVNCCHTTQGTGAAWNTAWSQATLDRRTLAVSQTADGTSNQRSVAHIYGKHRETGMSSDGQDATDAKNLTVYFDGACPLCRREINLYRKLKGSDDIAWVDVATADEEALGSGLTSGLAQRRFHVRDKNGQLASGASAFAQLWISLPSTSWLGRFTALPGVRHVADVAYMGFLRIRPFIQRAMPR